MEKPTLIIGTGALAQEVLDILSLQDTVVYGFVVVDATERNEIRDIPVLGALGDRTIQQLLADEQQAWLLALELPEQRHKTFKYLFDTYKRLPMTLAHPSATLSEYADLASGNIVLAQAVIGADVTIEAHNLLRAGVIVDSGASIGSYCTLGAGAIVGVGAKIGNHVTIGTGAIIHPNVTIDDEALIAPGAVVLQDVTHGQMMVGNPAQPLKK